LQIHLPNPLTGLGDWLPILGRKGVFFRGFGVWELVI
jgi:hypothetical protein